MAEASSIMTQFQPGDIVRNVNPRSLHHNKRGTFQRLHGWTFASGLACDVRVEGEQGPYGYDAVIMSVGDLELATDEQVQKAEIAAGIRRLIQREDVVPLARMFLRLAVEMM